MSPCGKRQECNRASANCCRVQGRLMAESSHDTRLIKWCFSRRRTMQTRRAIQRNDQEDLRAQLRKLVETRDQHAELLHEHGRVTTRIRFSPGDLKKVSALRRKVEQTAAKVSNSRREAQPSPAATFVTPAELLTEQMLASRWFCSRSRLQHWRSDGQGPRYLRIGGRILYPLADVKEFEAAHRAK